MTLHTTTHVSALRRKSQPSTHAAKTTFFRLSLALVTSLGCIVGLFCTGCGPSKPSKPKIVGRTHVPDDPPEDPVKQPQPDVVSQEAEEKKDKPVAVTTKPVPREKVLLKFDASGEQFSYVGESLAIGVFDLVKRLPGKTFFVPGMRPSCLDISKQRLVVGSADGRLKTLKTVNPEGMDDYRRIIWEREERLAGSLVTSAELNAVAIHPSDTFVFVATANGELIRWSLGEQSDRTYLGPSQGLVAFDTAPDESYALGVTSDGKLYYWDFRSTANASLLADTGADAVCLSSFGLRSVAVGQQSGAVCNIIPDEKGRNTKNQFRAADRLKAIKHLQNGSELLALTGDGQLVDWTLPVLPPAEHTLLSPTELITQSLDHQFYAVTSRGKSGHTNQLDIYRVLDGKAFNRCSVPLDEDITTATFADNDKSVVVGTAKGTTYFALLNPKGVSATVYTSLKTSNDAITKIVYLKNQRSVAALNSKGQLQTTQLPYSTHAPLEGLREERLNLTSISPNGKQILGVLLDSSQIVHVDLDSPEKKQHRELRGVQVTSLSINDSGTCCLGGSRGELMVWQASQPNSSPQSLTVETSGTITSLAIDDKSKLTAIDESGNLHRISLTPDEAVPLSATPTSFEISQDETWTFNPSSTRALRRRGDGQISLFQPSDLKSPPSFVPVSLDQPIVSFKLSDDQLVSAATTNGQIAFGSLDKQSANYLSFPTSSKPSDWVASKHRIVVALDNQQIIDVRHDLAPVSTSQLPVTAIQKIVWDTSRKTSVMALKQGVAFSVEGKQFPLNSPLAGVVQQLDISADGRYASALYEGAKLVVWRLDRDPGVIQQFDNVSSAEFGRDSLVVCKLAGEVVKVTGDDLEVSAAQKNVRGRILKMIAAPQSKRVLLVADSGELQILDVDRFELRTQPAEMNAGPVDSVCWSDDETFIAASQANGKVLFWHVNSDKVQVVESGVKGTIHSLALQMLPAPVLTLAASSGELVFMDLKSKTKLSQSLNHPEIVALDQVNQKIELTDENGRLSSFAIPRFYTASIPASTVTHVNGAGAAEHILVATSNGSIFHWPMDDATPREIGNVKSAINGLVCHHNRPQWIVSTQAHGLLLVDAKSTMPKPLSFKPVASTKPLGIVGDDVLIQDGTTLRLWSTENDIERQLPQDWPQNCQPQDLVFIDSTQRKCEVISRGKTPLSGKTQTKAQKSTLGEFTAIHANGGTLLVAKGTQLHALTASNISVTLTGLTAPAERVSLAPNGDHFAVTDDQGKLWLGSISANRLQPANNVAIPKGRSICWSPDSKTLAMMLDSNVNILQHTTGAVVAILAAPRPDARIVFLRDSQIGFLSKEGRIEQLPVSYPENVTVGANEGVLQILPLPDNRLGIATDTQWKVFDLNTRQMDAAGYPLLAKPVGVAFAEFTQTTFALLENGQVWMHVPSQEPRLLRVDGQRPWKKIDVDAMGKLCLMTDGFGTSLLGKIKPDHIERGKIPVDFPVMLARFVNSNDFLITAKDSAKVYRVSINGTILKQSKLQDITDATYFSDASRVAIANGESKIELMSTRSEDSFELGEAGWRYSRVACDQRGLTVAATAESEGVSGKVHEVHVWDALNLTLKAQLKIPREAECISMAPDGRMLAVLTGTNQIQVFDTVKAQLVESISAPFAVSLVRCSADSRAIWISQVDGKLVRQSLKRMETVKISEGPLTCLQLLSQGKTLLTGTQKGEVKLWNVGPSLTLLGALQGPEAPVLGCDLSSGAKQLLVLFDDPEHTACVWPAESIGKGNGSNPTVQFISEHRADVGIVNDDASRIFIGNDQGEIQAWSGVDGKLLYRFTGHQGPVIGLIANSNFSRLTSGGADRTVRNWSVPGTVEASTPVQQKLEPEAEIRLPEIAPPIDIPLASIGGNINTANGASGDTQLNLNATETVEIKEDGKVSIDEAIQVELREPFEQLKRAESELSNNASSDKSKDALCALSQARQKLATARKQILNRSGSGKDQNIASDLPNLLLTIRTNFDFKEPRFRPVRLCFTSDGKLFAARTAYPGTNLSCTIDAWDIWHGNQMRHWQDLPLAVQELIVSPDKLGVFTVPDLKFFNTEEGLSSPVFPAARWCKSSSGLLAVGTSGSAQSEDVIFRIFDVTDSQRFFQPMPETKCTFSAFEGVVTAMAFANNHSMIAFCVRERNQHRVFLADPDAFYPDRFRMIAEDKKTQSWLSVGNPNDHAMGITSLSFSPNDDLLMSHGGYGNKTFRFTGWELDPEAASKGGDLGGKIREKVYLSRETAEEPLMINSSRSSFMFIRPSAVAKTSKETKPTTSGRQRQMLIETAKNLVTYDYNKDEVFNAIPLTPTQFGRPQFATTSDGRWTIIGQDNGEVFIWNNLTKKKYGLTGDGRPAHSGPIVGVALSETNPVSQFPDFAATAGEENEIRVWNLIPLFNDCHVKRL